MHGPGEFDVWAWMRLSGDICAAAPDLGLVPGLLPSRWEQVIAAARMNAGRPIGAPVSASQAGRSRSRSRSRSPHRTTAVPQQLLRAGPVLAALAVLGERNSCQAFTAAPGSAW